VNLSEWNNRANQVFASALDLPQAERHQFLAKACGGDGSLREQVDLLLFEHERSGLLDRPLFPLSLKNEGDLWTDRVLQGRYKIERLLGRGGMSAVYLARDLQLAGRTVVVKFLHSWARQHAWLEKRFRQEMDALARIDHQAVVGVLDIGETPDGLPYLVIEFIDGITLRVAIQQGPLALARAARILREAGSAVSAAHANGVLHRDVKPENIMLQRPDTPEEHVRLIDFGIARVEETAGSQLATQMTQFAGTTPYMAPEQLRGKPVPASDTYALAVVACEMLTGQRPFTAATPVDLYDQQRAGPSLAMLHARKDIPEEAVRAIARQLSFNPGDRSVSVRDATEQIAAALLRPAIHGWPRRKIAAWAGAGLFVALGGGAYRTFRPQGLAPSDRIIELPPAAEPLEHGFSARGVIDWRIISNADATTYEAMRVFTSDQGGYYRELSRAQAAVANREGWKLMGDFSVEEGSATVNIDVPNASHRYAVNLIRNKTGPDTIRLVTAIMPEVKGLDWAVPGPPGLRHAMMLQLPPGSQAAELWVDGSKRLTGYYGLDQYRYHRGPEFGVSRYRSAGAAGVFWKFRLEIGT
jgi:tRNA A-37 threonylcarbamoyl transferase component Bud32